MKRIGALGGISAQATMDFEARVHQRVSDPVSRTSDVVVVSGGLT